MIANQAPPPTKPLPTIPFVDIGSNGPIALFENEPARAEEIVRLGREKYGSIVIGFLDQVSKHWAASAGNPYVDEIRHMARQMPPGIWFMNLCLEWACTSGVMNDPTAPGMRLLRTLDWPFHGLGRNLVIAKQEGPAGSFLNLTWPGFAGTVQGMAPGRFALALNQAPLVRHLSLPVYVDWLVNRIKVFSSKRIPPLFLLRCVLETCHSYAQARDLLETTPIALPAIFSLVGTETGEGCVIERLERRAVVHEGPAAAANHWAGMTFQPGKPRGRESLRRHRLMNGFTRSHVENFDWLNFPILNEDTRLAMSANPKAGELRAQGFEADGAATAIFDLKERTNK
tara:strand:- start:31874 stop:32899 length:1026 start_codon:yes stop_codon:yes gene_type:complete